jgi:hypothetical protein
MASDLVITLPTSVADSAATLICRRRRSFTVSGRTLDLETETMSPTSIRHEMIEEPP